MDKNVAHRFGLLHDAVHIFVIDQKNRLILQRRRKDKLLQPGAWDSSASGHVTAGDTLLESAVRETKEELGIRVRPLPLGEITTRDRQRTYDNHERVGYYFARTTQRLRYQRSELAGFTRIPLRDVSQFLRRHRCSLMLVRGWKKFGKQIMRVAVQGVRK
jgi:isopentenyldiphosphate isomerase